MLFTNTEVKDHFILNFLTPEEFFFDKKEQNRFNKITFTM